MRLLDATDPHWPPDPSRIDLTDPDWLTPQQAAAAARVSERSIWRWLGEREIAIRIGGRVWISRRRMFGQ